MSNIERLKSLLPNSLMLLIRRIYFFIQWDPWQQRTWSQEGEDQILQRIFEQQKSGFYVDIGAHHPNRFSNTYLFYRRGWFGINVDAMPGSMDAFHRERPRDINVETGIAEAMGTLDYYIFNEPALNGFSKQLSEQRNFQSNPYRIIKTKQVTVKTLTCLLDEYLSDGQIIDFLTIDVEGLDLGVLKSNNWGKYRPKIVLVEVLGSSLHEIIESPIANYMQAQDYSLYAKCMNTVFFKNNRVSLI
ncbi:FkbM family methyltransferase [Methylotuvimicrobium sp. KM1]|uniref:FkbM family methyltransferase n=1 Tax=Methylotuvimicrobium sp. KM1 TaxID=3377707 RepID=UPI00384BCDB8